MRTVQAPQVPWPQPTRVPVSPSLSRSTSTSSASPSTNSACSVPLTVKISGSLAMAQPSSPESSRRRCTGSTAAPVPGAGLRVVLRRRVIGGDRDGGLDRRGVERPALEGGLDRPRPHRPRRHRAIGDTDPGDPAAGCGQERCDRQHRGAVRMLAGDLEVAERAFGRCGEADGADDATALRPFAQERLQLLARLAVGPLADDAGTEGKQRHGEVAVGAAGEEVAADGRHRPHCRTADRTRRPNGGRRGPARPAPAPWSRRCRSRPSPQARYDRGQGRRQARTS